MRYLVCALLLAGSAFAGESYYDVSLADVRVSPGDPVAGDVHWNPRVVLDGPGEGYVSFGRDGERLALRAPEGRDVTGTVFSPQRGRVPFRVPAAAAREVAEGPFRRLKRVHYQRLLERDIPGAFWFRHRLIEAGVDADPDARPRARRIRESELQRTYSFFTGGRAVSENLQLDRVLPGSVAGKADVALDSIEGITVPEMDWKPYVDGVEVAADPLARHIPADQYAFFFPTFEAMLAVLDAADAEGTPILHAVEPRTEDARTRERYDRQLCLHMDKLVRALGPKLIASVAFTGSDPYLRTGTDVAILFEARTPDALAGILKLRRKAAAEGVEGVVEVAGRIGESDYHGLVSPRRRISSYQAQVGDAVVISNSVVQLERVVREQEGLAALPEYTFFRKRYLLGEAAESALLVIPDAAIRKWCGPRWRIASSRRIRAAAVMAELEASELDRLVSGVEGKVPLKAPWPLVDAGNLSLTATGAFSSIYNTREFLTPVSEMEFTHATEAEASLYRRWRDGYQRNWSRFFDPIAVRLTVAEDRLAVDLTVMPLILGSEYAQWLDVVRGSIIAADSGDPHAGALVHLAVAIDKNSAPVQQAGNFLQAMAGKAGLHALGWLGKSVAVYLDDDELFAEALAAEDPEDFLEERLHRIPIAIHAESESPMKLAAFVATARVFIQQSAPGTTVWTAHKHGDHEYVKVSATKEADFVEDLVICYATLPDALVISLSEDLLKRILDRKGAAAEQGVRPWLGKHICFQIRREWLEILDKVFGENFRREMRSRSWGNLEILNELRRRYPDHDPVKLHERITGVALLCPGGGRYVWNEEWQTMESTAFGHPGRAVDGPADILPFRGWKAGNFGLTFEKEGLRAACELLR